MQTYSDIIILKCILLMVSLEIILGSGAVAITLYAGWDNSGALVGL